MYVLFLIYDRHSWIQLDFKHIEIFSEIQYIPKPQHQNIFDQNLINVSRYRKNSEVYKYLEMLHCFH